MYFHFTAKRAVIRCWRSRQCPLGPIKRSIAVAGARSIETIISTTLTHNQPSLMCVPSGRGHTRRKSSMKNAQLLECYFGAWRRTADGRRQTADDRQQDLLGNRHADEYRILCIYCGWRRGNGQREVGRSAAAYWGLMATCDHMATSIWCKGL